MKAIEQYFPVMLFIMLFMFLIRQLFNYNLFFFGGLASELLPVCFYYLL